MRLDQWIKSSSSDEAEFALMIGTSEIAVRRYCRGERIPARDKMENIWRATGGAVTPNDFYDFTFAGDDGCSLARNPMRTGGNEAGAQDVPAEPPQ